MIDFENLPPINSKKYHEIMDKIVKSIEEKLNISVYGYTDYKRIAFYWLDENGKIFGESCSIPFSVAKRYLEK